MVVRFRSLVMRWSLLPPPLNRKDKGAQSKYRQELYTATTT
jgi:hypothetical protein